MYHMVTPQHRADQLAACMRVAVEESGISRRELALRTGIPLVTLQRRLTTPGGKLQAAEAFAIADALATPLSGLVALAETSAT